MMPAILGVVAAIAAALIARSVTISNHRQAWINGLRDDLAAFFTAIDVIHFRMAMIAHGGDVSSLEEQKKARNDVLLAHRKILMRLNMSETLHNELAKSLEPLLMVRGEAVDQEQLATSVALARTILKREWEVTKYGAFTTPIVQFKDWWRRRQTPRK